MEEFSGSNEGTSVLNWMIKRFKTSTVLVVLLVAVVSCKEKQQSNVSSRVEALPYYQDPSFTPYWMEKNSEDLINFHTIPSFSLLNQSGEIITEATVKDHIYITDFFFTTCPGICPKMTQNMGVLQELFKNNDDVLLLSHTAMPKVDRVSVLNSYAEDHGVLINKWHLLTGGRKELYKLGREAYFIEEDLGLQRVEEDFLHTENFVLIDKNRHIRGIYNGLNTASIQQLAADVKTLQLE